jgi:hypothetical protein
MDAHEIALEIEEIICMSIEEPAGTGCGYGITEDGQDELKAFIETLINPLRKDSIMSDTTTTQVFAPIKKKGNYKVTARTVAYKTHKNTNMVLEEDETIIMDDKVFKAYTQELAVFAAMTEIEGYKGEKKVDMSDLKVSACLF